MTKPDWTRDELILALDLYFREPSARGSKSHSEVIELSKFLKRLPIHDSEKRDSDFRNPNGVGMKLSNFLRLDPDYPGEGLKRGSRLEAEVWEAFAGNQSRLRVVATAIRENSNDLAAPWNPLDLDDDDEAEAEEGHVLTRAHRVRERNQGLVEKKKQQVLKSTGQLACEVCGFNFRDRYGARGSGYAECHHAKPVSELKPGARTKLVDLVVLCANCHRMVHRRRPWLSLEKLKTILCR